MRPANAFLAALVEESPDADDLAKAERYLRKYGNAPVSYSDFVAILQRLHMSQPKRGK